MFHLRFLLAVMVLFTVLCDETHSSTVSQAYQQSVASPNYNSKTKQGQKNEVHVGELANSLNSLPRYSAGLADAVINANLPPTWLDMRTNHKDEYDLMPASKSIWHNFKEGIKPTRWAMTRAWIEYAFLDRTKWTYLDPNFPNIKYVSKDGHKEAVYNMYTGELVKSGVNQGTANEAEDSWEFAHWDDAIVRFPTYGPPTDFNHIIAQKIKNDPSLLAEFLKRIKSIDAAKRSWIAKLFVPSAGEADELLQVEYQKLMLGETQDLHSLNLDDPNGDWCKCEERGEKPGCDANMDPVKGYVIFGCTKCKKVNVKYAKMALELEQKMKAAGTTPTWHGQNADANAHRAASGK